MRPADTIIDASVEQYARMPTSVNPRRWLLIPTRDALRDAFLDAAGCELPFAALESSPGDLHAILEKVLALSDDEQLRKNLREVDQPHPMVNNNLWLFGEDWHMTRSELGLTNVLHARPEDHLGEDVVLEHELESLTQPDGRSGRVDILMFRSRRDDNSTERLVIELKRPTPHG
ncbi:MULTISPECIES: hypothetical protein [unclassified Streptomyces]|uniref:hypothetical protein n=1 Tax=unclassified Streptomyces TaxID=2593676 RepID=UPI00344CC853